MKKLALSVLLGSALFLVGCTSAKNTEIPEDRTKWEGELKKSVEKLNDEDKSLFTQYIVRKIMTNGEVKSGTTIGDAIQDQKNWKSEQEAKEKAQAELKAKIDAKNKALKKQMDEILTTAIISKSGHSRHEYIDSITDIGFQLAFENHTNKDISGFKGIIVFKDMFGDTIKNLTLSYDDGVKAKSTAKYDGITDYNEFMDEDNKLLNTSLDKINFEFKPSIIMFTDGTKIEMKEAVE